MSTLCRASMLLLLLVAAAPSRPAGGIAPGLPAGAAAEGASVAKPPAQGKTASLLFFYYGDSKYETLGQEALKLKKALEGHDFNVLLKHESLPSWADLSEKDEKLANIKDLPTKANFFKYLVKLAKDGYHDIDVLLFVHGSDGWFKASTGKDKSSDMVTAEDIKAELAPAKTGLPRIPIRAVWGTNCYGSTLLDAWLAVGARTAAGARSGEWCDGGLDLEVNACRIKLAKGVKCGTAGSLGNDHKCKSGECSGFPKYVCK